MKYAVSYVARIADTLDPVDLADLLYVDVVSVADSMAAGMSDEQIRRRLRAKIDDVREQFLRREELRARNLVQMYERVLEQARGGSYDWESAGLSDDR